MDSGIARGVLLLALIYILLKLPSDFNCFQDASRLVSWSRERVESLGGCANPRKDYLIRRGEALYFKSQQRSTIGEP